MKRSFFIFLSFAATLNNLQAQNIWEKNYGQGIGYWVEPTADGGYILGTSQGLIKLDVMGNEMWRSAINGYDAACVKQMPDGGYIFTGSTRFLVRTDAKGDTLWTNNSDINGLALDFMYDGGFVIAGWNKFTGAHVFRTDSKGDTIWTKVFNSISEQAEHVIATTDSGVVVTINHWAPGGFIKLDKNGNAQWTNGNIDGVIVRSNSWVMRNYIFATPDSNFLHLGYGRHPSDTGMIDGITFCLKEFSATGTLLKTKHFASFKPISVAWFYSILPADSGYLLAGSTNRYGNAAGNNFYIIRVDQNLDSLWSATYGANGDQIHYSSCKAHDGGYLLAGLSNSTGDNQIYVVKINDVGITVNGNVEGTVFLDDNGNCIRDSAETGLKNRLIRVDPGPGYRWTDSNGVFRFQVDTGTFTVAQVFPDDLFRITPSCPDSYTITIAAPHDSANGLDFSNEATAPCPVLNASIGATRHRLCRKNTYTVTYSNTGSTKAVGVYVELNFPKYLIPLSSTIPWRTPQKGNKYIFDIGTVDIGETGSFIITDSISCNAPLNSTVCVYAHIFPDDPCGFIDSTWDKSSIAVTVNCIGDTLVRFVIYNTGDPGDGDMTGVSDYRLFENNALIKTDTFRLNGGDSLVIELAANGNAFRLEADQRPGHPGKSRPNAEIEGCGTPVAFGNIGRKHLDDKDLFIDILCSPVRNSFDPNEKSGAPAGVTSSRYISDNDRLEYSIRFQNTGNDTAFLVVIRDTLSEFVDPATFTEGSASHPFELKFYGSRSLEWRFKNIQLPDSTTDEPGSHGFVSFSIEQIPGNPKGTVIENRAGIWFDYNLPVQTNTVVNVVWDTTIIGTSGIARSYLDGLQILVYPNPFSEFFTIDIPGQKDYTVTLFDLTGREAFSSRSNGNELTWVNGKPMPTGMYLFRVETKGRLIGAGKVVMQ